MEDAETADCRYERKYFLPGTSRQEAEAAVRHCPGAFSPSYPPRTVNNIYLDDLRLSAYRDNLDGASTRQKIRIRWYGPRRESVERPVLEVKARHGEVGTKASFPLPPLTVGESLSAACLQSLFDNAGLPECTRLQLLNLQPVLLNCYRRSYMQTPERQLRATVDTEMAYAALPPSGGGPGACTIDHRNAILEIKYAASHDARWRDMAQALPYRISRSSKYATGIEATHLVY
jgi:hypothetical protein